MFGSFAGNGNPFGLPGHGFGGGQVPQRFDEHYRCYPVTFLDKNQSHLEDGDKILLPPSALETLARLHIDYPMLFKLSNDSLHRHTHCGVMEFSAPEGSCYLPYWMMQNLLIQEGGIIRIENATLPKATFVKIRPQSTTFLDISNPRAVLEASLRKFSCMTVGDTIRLRYNDRAYFLDVREVKPADAACIIETDCEVDFDAPADYIAPPSTQTSYNTAPPSPSNLPYGGMPTINANSYSQNGKRPSGTSGGLRLNNGEKKTDASFLRDERMKKFEAFHGTGRSLSGGVLKAPKQNFAASTTASKPIKNIKAKEETKEDTQNSPFSGPGRRLR